MDSSQAIKLEDAFSDLVEITGCQPESHIIPVCHKLTAGYQDLLDTPEVWAQAMFLEYPNYQDLNPRVHAALTTYF